MQKEKEILKKDPDFRQCRDEILGLGQDKDQMLRLQHYRDRMLGLVDEEPLSKQEKLNMWSIKEGNENILRLDEYMNELKKLQDTREEMLRMQREGLMRLQQDREEMLKMQQDGLLKLQRDREEIMHLQEELLAALQQGTSSEEKMQKTMEKMMQLQEDNEQMFLEQQNRMLTFQKDGDDLDRGQQSGLFDMKENKFFQLIKKKSQENLCKSLDLQQMVSATEDKKEVEKSEKKYNNKFLFPRNKQLNSISEKKIELDKQDHSKLQMEIAQQEQRKKSEEEDTAIQREQNPNLTKLDSVNNETALVSKPSQKKAKVQYSKHYEKAVSIDKRNFGMDVIRSVAVFFVLSIHFFLYNGYYALPQIGIKVWLADWGRCFVFVGVPLFLMITGYLRGNKKLTKQYYLGIIPILLTWVVATVICVAFKIYYLDIHKSISLWIAEIFNFSGATYSWYIEMYIGIFLLCPFINKITEQMDKKQFQILLGTMAALTFLPTLTNRWGGIELNLNILPDYWMALYPFTYYFIGSYIRKFQVKLPFIKGIVFALLFAMIKGSIIYYTADGGKFIERIGDGYSDLFVAGTSICLFLAFYDLKTKNRELKRIFYHISKVSLALYLVSWVFDRILYVLIIPYVSIDNYLLYYFIFVPTSFFCSLLVATVVERMVQWMYRTGLNCIVELKNRKNSPEKFTYKGVDKK